MNIDLLKKKVSGTFSLNEGKLELSVELPNAKLKMELEAQEDGPLRTFVYNLLSTISMGFVPTDDGVAVGDDIDDEEDDDGPAN
jgi:hypothetical protein